MNIKELEKRCNELFFQVNEKTERIAELEKENAELKLKLEAFDEQTPWKDIKDKSEVIGQLTNAKELLERFLGLGNLWDLDCKDYFPLRKEVEQFLNSEVEK